MAIIKRAWNKTFLVSLVLVLGAQILVIVIASFLLDFNTNQWIRDKAAQTVRISQEASTTANWSQIQKITGDGKTSPQFTRYHRKVMELTQQHFRAKQGSVFIAIIDRGEEYDIDNGDSYLSDMGKANDVELAAYSSHRPTHTTAPISDEQGTYFAAYTPIISSGKVVGLVSAEFDSAPLADFQEIVRSVFWGSAVPALIFSLVISYFFASTFVEPLEVLREIEGARQQVSERSETAEALWASLTPAQRHVFQLLGQGLKDSEMASELSLSTHTIKSHVKSIRAKMREIGGDDNISRVDLAFAARAILQASTPSEPAAAY